MAIVYEVDLTESGINEYKGIIKNLKLALKSREFLEYIEKKAFETLQEITLQNLYTTDQDTSNYYKNHQHKIVNNEIWLWNQTLVDLSYLGEEAKQRYQNLSLAKIVEYGTGIRGENSNQGLAKDWKYKVNPDRDYSKGWVYKDGNGYHFSRGVEAKLVFYKTKVEIKKQIPNWVNSYLKEKKLN